MVSTYILRALRGQAAARAQYALCRIFLERSFFSEQTALGRRLTSLSGSIATFEMYDGFVNAKRNWLIHQYGMPSRDHGGDVEDEARNDRCQRRLTRQLSNRLKTPVANKMNQLWLGISAAYCIIALVTASMKGQSKSGTQRSGQVGA